MAYFARLDENNIVTHVSKVDNKKLLDYKNVEKEELGRNWLIAVHGPSRWIQTSFNGRIRGTFAGVGYTYDPVLDIFVPPTGTL